jgi:ubiquinone/menaquinone biosynthesis C-methylase UbiE
LVQTQTSYRASLAELRKARLTPLEVAAPGERGDEPHADAAAMRHRVQRIGYWDRVASIRSRWEGLGGAYHRRLERVYRFLVPPGRRVLELGCGRGDLLSALEPSVGVGVDFSPEMVRQAREAHAPTLSTPPTAPTTRLKFVEGDVHLACAEAEGPFDVVILSDLVNELWDVQAVLQSLARVCTPRTRIIVNTYSRLWDWPLALASRLNLAKPTLRQNWLTVHDIENMLQLAGFETLRSWPEVLCPLGIPGVAPVCNRFLARLWPFKHLCLANFIVARPVGALNGAAAGPPVVSVVVPARNEAGNIEAIFARTPEMGAGSELIFVEGHSRDDTYEQIEQAIAAHPDRRAKLLKQPGKGKADAVRAGFAAATGDVLMILDADLTVPPEQLPRFLEALEGGTGEFINGVRLVYPMEGAAMRPLNLAGNKFFGMAFSWLLGQSIRDTLCGTKVLRREDYELIAANRAYFGDFDPFGDFDLLFGASRLGLKIVDLPIRYRERTYGSTNISRFRHGLLLFRMVGYAAMRLKFI